MFAAASLHLLLRSTAVLVLESAPLFWVDTVAVYPTCVISPQDQVVFEVLVVTLYTPAFLYQPTAVSVVGNDVAIDLYVDNGVAAAIDHLLVVVDIGRLSAGDHGYTVTVHDPSGAVSDTAAGSIAVVDAPCPSIGSDPRRMFWAEWYGALRRSSLNGARVESIVPSGFAGASGFAVDFTSHRMYWTERAPARIRVADLDGSNVQELVLRNECQAPTLLVLDLQRGKMYWLEYDLCTHNDYSIQRSNLDGSNIEAVATAPESQHDLVVDSAAGQIFWCQGSPSSTGEELWRAELDGANATAIVGDFAYLSSLVLDPIRRKLYWVDGAYGASGRVRRADTDGSNVETLVGNLAMADVLTLDLVHSKMYWSDAGWIRRADLNGSNIENLITGFANPNGPSGMTLDLAAGQLYWCEPTTDRSLNGRIGRANLDGSNIEALVTGVRYPFGFVLEEVLPIPTLSLWALGAMSVLLIAAGAMIQRRRITDRCPPPR